MDQSEVKMIMTRNGVGSKITGGGGQKSIPLMPDFKSPKGIEFPEEELKLETDSFDLDERASLSNSEDSAEAFSSSDDDFNKRDLDAQIDI